jgi:hypothetical protein
VKDNLLEEAVDELIHSIETRTLTLGYLAPLRNFKLLGLDSITFPNGVCIRRLSESEATRLYGGMFPVFKTSFGPPSEFTFAGEVEQPFVLSDERVPDAKSIPALVLAPIVAAEEILMSYKAGPVVHDWISVTFAKVSLTGTLNMAVDAAPRPAKELYEIVKTDVPRIIEQFGLTTAHPFPAFAAACKRLAESERRTTAVDAILDAVIGLEMLLLGSNERDGFRFRFALNYATLSSNVEPNDRRVHFKAASDLYKVRSKVVHTAVSPDKKFTIGDESLAIDGVAKKAKEMLRTTINAFFRLQVPTQPRERERWLEEFWELGYFGLR